MTRDEQIIALLEQKCRLSRHAAMMTDDTIKKALHNFEADTWRDAVTIVMLAQQAPDVASCVHCGHLQLDLKAACEICGCGALVSANTVDAK